MKRTRKEQKIGVRTQRWTTITAETWQGDEALWRITEKRAAQAGPQSRSIVTNARTMARSVFRSLNSPQLTREGWVEGPLNGEAICPEPRRLYYWADKRGGCFAEIAMWSAMGHEKGSIAYWACALLHAANCLEAACSGDDREMLIARAWRVGLLTERLEVLAEPIDKSEKSVDGLAQSALERTRKAGVALAGARESHSALAAGWRHRLETFLKAHQDPHLPVKTLAHAARNHLKENAQGQRVPALATIAKVIHGLRTKRRSHRVRPNEPDKQ